MRLQIPKKLDFLIKKKKRYKVAYGGRGAGKSWCFADILLVKALEKKSRVLCVRELQTSIKDSVHRLLADRIMYHKLDKFFDITESEIRGSNGSLFLFKGLRSNAAEIKSLEGVDFCWIEEAQKVSEVSLDLLFPTIRKEDSEIWISFNTGAESDPVYQRFVTTNHPEAAVQKIGYADNPWFPEVLRKDMEHDRLNNPDRYDNVWAGNPGVEGAFFTEFAPAHLHEAPFQVELSSLEGRLFGSLDHGTTHATSFGLWYIDDDFKIHRICSYYASGSTVAEHARMIHDTIESMTWTMGYMPDRVFADPSMWTVVKKSEADQWSPIDEYVNFFKEAGHKTQFVKANNDKVNGCQVMRFLFKETAEAQPFRYFDGYNKSFVEGMAVEVDMNNREKYAKQENDDAADEARYGMVGCWSMVAILRQRVKHKAPKSHLQKLLAGKFGQKKTTSNDGDWYNG